MSEKQIDFEKDFLFVNHKTGEVGIGEVLYEEVTIEGTRGIPYHDDVYREVKWKFGGMNVESSYGITAYPMQDHYPPIRRSVKKKWQWFGKKK